MSRNIRNTANNLMNNEIIGSIASFSIGMVIGRYLNVLLVWVGIGLFIFAAFMGWTWMGILLITTLISTVIVTIIYFVVEFFAMMFNFRTDKICYLILLIALDVILIFNGGAINSTNPVQQTQSVQSAPQPNIPTLQELMNQ
jgi:hypothetical protein